MKPTIALLAIFLVGCGCQSYRGFPESHQIRNFDKVTPELWRGSQPNAEGFRWLAAQGCKTVVCLLPKSEVFPAEESIVTNLGMRFYSEPMVGWRLFRLSAADRASVSNALRIIETNVGPTYAHCLHGADRTSVVVECWRIRHGWTPQQAQQEADCYGMSKWELGMRSFIKHYRP